ncbi:molecular chaperone DnaJ [Dactylosporangium siamense]|uniref:FtsH ternary system domain-containing protein n=1 Tax=Dactylosporangium siamense TaxID=685454 RepID=A0A919PTN2_9ACTN|nr:molecular chaperone DnaJ [Dactylosporangium siamense]GIG50002.1 hypothetical protein Dsi01nite_080430 [Dactylosporangium siamense]
MCNPRRIRVSATRELNEAWQEQVERAVTRVGAAVGVARLREPLDATVGGPTLVMLERALAAADGWVQDGDAFRRDLDGGYVTYHADTSELEIVAEVSAEVSAGGRATRTIGGHLDTRIEATGVGVFYDDLYDGVTEDDARRNAQDDLRRNLDAGRQQLLREAVQAEEQRLAADLDRAAGDQADIQLARVTAERETELRQEAARRLTAIGIEARGAFHRILADAYRDAILAYARTHGAEGLSVVERDGALEIEFELEA